MLKSELLEIRRSKILLHRAKADNTYPTIRLPYTFSKLAGVSIRITVHDGALTFPWLCRRRQKAVQINAKTPPQAPNPSSSHSEVADPNPAEPIVLSHRSCKPNVYFHTDACRAVNLFFVWLFF
jgi:hypothetical protein